jgi:hypothetical protein
VPQRRPRRVMPRALLSRYRHSRFNRSVMMSQRPWRSALGTGPASTRHLLVSGKLLRPTGLIQPASDDRGQGAVHGFWKPLMLQRQRSFWGVPERHDPDQRCGPPEMAHGMSRPPPACHCSGTSLETNARSIGASSRPGALDWRRAHEKHRGRSRRDHRESNG